MKLKIDGTTREINKASLTTVSVIDKLIRRKMSKTMGDVYKAPHWPERPAWRPARCARGAETPEHPHALIMELLGYTVASINLTG